jgi:hypothetical protein
VGEARQLDPKTGSPIQLAGKADLAAETLDDTAANGKAETGAHANLLGGEKGLEDAVAMFRRNFLAGIADLGADPLSFTPGTHADFVVLDMPLGNGVGGIDELEGDEGPAPPEPWEEDGWADDEMTAGFGRAPPE